MRPWFIVLFSALLITVFNANAGADVSLPTYGLVDIIGIAVERNPLVAGALAAIDQSTGQRTAAGA
jgi:hypothetical protein